MGVSNGDIEKMMEGLSSHKNADKFKAVAGQICKERKYDLARKMQKVWEERRDLIRIGNQDEINKWRSATFFEDSLCEASALSLDPIGASSAADTVVPFSESTESRTADTADPFCEFTVESSECATSSVPPPSSRGRPRKRLSDNVGRKTENKMLDGLLEMIEDFAGRENISPESLLQKLVERSHTKWGADESTKTRDVPVEDACALIYNINFSIQQYQKLRIHLLDHNINLPVRNEIDTYKKTLQCEYTVESTKTSCLFPVLFKDTVESLIELNNVSISSDDVVKVEGKIGIDGSGSHQIRHQVADTEKNTDDDDEEKKAENNYIGVFWCPLSINVNNKCVWYNILPNSIMYSRPLCLLREKESRESVLEHFKPYIDEIHKMEAEDVITLNSKPQLVSAHTELSMIDGKMADYIQGDSGSYCHYCNVTRAEANDLTVILQGFSIEKTIDELVANWEKIDSGDIVYTAPERYGQCHEPMNKADLRFFAIMHQKLRSLDNCLKLLYHIVSGQTHTWSESNCNVKDAVKAAKKKCISHIRKECWFLVDCPTQIGGNTNTGPVAQKF